ncbi:class I SAM-dependent methyltransferase [Bradyrhizobium sp. WD16]|uniref:class I SAM-dependent methyltransferase n=1 Tax=Bradyrhizobium sp. WD16 TaxID=1521768 RepID=UPI0020A57940|nr:methyltransferase domain-containing protein [Bradyrhizobium sp. WD16]UTD29757.1 methyltransferase [Bradyrhizobium sp. WD16]
MSRTLAKYLIQLGAACALGLVISTPSFAADVAHEDQALRAAINGSQRSARFLARDGARHPYEELTFFEITPRYTVVEIWPGAGYWTEILAHYLNESGVYYAAVEPQRATAAPTANAFNTKLNSDKAIYGRVRITEFSPPAAATLAPDGSVDLILTFRNLHNWLKQGNAAETLAAFHRALKPGGILGIEDHRGQRDVPQDPQASDGYVRQDYAIALVESAGFEFVAASEVNANPKDTANWPKGVWTLPPTFALGDTDREKYAAIGEADNFVLKFRKPR